MQKVKGECVLVHHLFFLLVAKHIIWYFQDSLLNAQYFMSIVTYKLVRLSGSSLL